MKNSKKKRYLITYKEPDITFEKVTSILELNETQLKEGIIYLATAAKTKKEDVFHFSNLSISSIELNSEDLEKFKGKKEIFRIEEDVEMYIQGFLSENVEPLKIVTKPNISQVNVLWNMNLVKAPAAWGRNRNGNGINVAILDTGIATHPDLVISGGVSFVQGVTSYNDGNGHGTHCAGIIGGIGIMAPNNYNVFGVAPKANLFAVKVLADNGTGYLSNVIAGMDWCITNKIQVVSMSLGSNDSPIAAYSQAVKKCQDSDITVVCASGNEFIDQTFPWVGAPANSYIDGKSNECPIAVGAIDSNSIIANFSSRGGKTLEWNQIADVAPGVGIYSTYLDNVYATMSGTSMACPHAAGFAALLYQRYPDIGPKMVKAKMGATATNLGVSPFPNTPYGFGIINCDVATK